MASFHLKFQQEERENSSKFYDTDQANPTFEVSNMCLIFLVLYKQRYLVFIFRVRFVIFLPAK